jgi:hypothetical protein
MGNSLKKHSPISLSFLQAIQTIKPIMSKTTPKKLSISRLPVWDTEWWRWLKNRGRQQALQFPFYPAVSSIVTLILVTILYISFSLHRISWESFSDWSEELTIIMFIVAIILFALSFVWVFILSSHPKTRKWADKYFGFTDQAEIEELKGTVENIETRLGSIEDTLKILTDKGKRRGQ